MLQSMREITLTDTVLTTITFSVMFVGELTPVHFLMPAGLEHHGRSNSKSARW